MSGARAMLQTARSHLGYREGAGNRNRFSTAMGRPAESWCADFVAAVAAESGNAGRYPDTASCAAARAWFDRRDRLSVYPAVGAQVLFGTPDGPYGAGGEHTGLVTAYTPDIITVIAGNTNDDGSANGDGVYQRTYRRRSAYVDSYGYPDFPEGLVCADPAWRSRPGVTWFGQQADESDLPTPLIPRQVVIDGHPYGPGSHGPHVTTMGRLLVAAGCSHYTVGPGPDWGPADTASMRAYQLRIGDTGPDADGIPGPRQLHRLQQEFGDRI
ncbi:peptidoglycan-binding protein [Kitasatospora sp. NPDC096147]|uniref:peptidoglycan-binding protein n=1 Tax=Kitasatospora sp. NPDC096147 TaxID=3364093 RepID=UPI0037F6D499